MNKGVQQSEEKKLERRRKKSKTLGRLRKRKQKRLKYPNRYNRGPVEKMLIKEKRRCKQFFNYLFLLYIIFVIVAVPIRGLSLNLGIVRILGAMIVFLVAGIGSMIIFYLIIRNVIKNKTYYIFKRKNTLEKNKNLKLRRDKMFETYQNVSLLTKSE